jgi:hypothetical protein
LRILWLFGSLVEVAVSELLHTGASTRRQASRISHRKGDGNEVAPPAAVTETRLS